MPPPTTIAQILPLARPTNMDVSFSANLHPRPQVRRQRGTLMVQFPHTLQKMRIMGIMSARKTRDSMAGAFLAHDENRLAHNMSASLEQRGADSGAPTTVICPHLVNISGGIHAYQQFLTSAQKNDGHALKSLLRQWLLVLESQKIPFVSYRLDNSLRLYVPALLAPSALAEINEYSLEGTRQASFLPSRPWWLGAVCIGLCLFVWHLLRFNALAWVSLPSPPFPVSPAQWVNAFGLDVHRTVARGEWWRLVTALTLHSDLRHLLSNILMGGAFFALLAGRVGFRRSFFLMLAGGALGNAVSLVFKASSVVSIGFSTACFALLGIVGAYVFCDTAQVRLRYKGVELLHAPRWFTPLAAGLALLAFLGGAGQPQTDFIAHASGAGVGVLLGCFGWFVGLWSLGRPIMAKFLAHLCFVVACGIIGLSWYCALVSFASLAS